jgi:hypothetical protein
LTRTYKVLTGSELIRLGIRDCNKPIGPNYAVARAKPAPNSASGVFGAMAEVFSPSGAPASAVQVKAQRVRVATATAPVQQARPETPRPEAPSPTPENTPTPIPSEATPQPPPRPADLGSAAPRLSPPAPGVTPPTPAPNTPSPEPTPPPLEVRISSQWGRPIVGSVPILKVTRFMPFAYRALKKG